MKGKCAIADVFFPIITIYILITQCCVSKNLFPEHVTHYMPLPFLCSFRYATLSWCGRRSVRWQVEAWEVHGEEPAVCLRAVRAFVAVREGRATPLPIRKDLESWSPQERTWGCRLWPWPPLLPDIAPAGLTRCAERNIPTLRPLPLESAAQWPVQRLCQFCHCQTPPLYWEAHKIHLLQRKHSQHQPKTHRHFSPHPHKPRRLQHLLQKQLLSHSILAPSPTGQMPLEAGQTLLCPYRWAKSHLKSCKQKLFHHSFISSSKIGSSVWFEDPYCCVQRHRLFRLCSHGIQPNWVKYSR